MKNQAIPATPVSQNSTLSGAFSIWLNRPNFIYSSLMDETVTNAGALRYVNFSAALVCILLSPAFGIIGMFLCLAWLIWSFILCKKGGLL